MDFKQFEKKIERLHTSEIDKILTGIIYEMGEMFLNAVQDEIYRQDLVDTALLVNSFARNEEGNVWKFDQERNTLTLEVGSNLTYAEYLNEGYTMDKGHFVPGYWNTDGQFIYDPEAKGGFFARPRSFIGRKYFDIALKEFQGGMKKLIEKRLEKELERVMR